MCACTGVGHQGRFFHHRCFIYGSSAGHGESGVPICTLLAVQPTSSWLATALLKGRGAVGKTHGVVCEVTPASYRTYRVPFISRASPRCSDSKSCFYLKIFCLKPTKDVEHAPAVATKCCENSTRMIRRC